MFNPAEETERDWDTELRDDVKGECENKYGKVAEIYVEKDSAVRLSVIYLTPGFCD
jgi:RNA-binding protein 39